MTLFQTKADKVLEFHTAASADGLIDKMNPGKRAQIEAFVQEYRASQAPELAQREYHLKIAPLELVFARTRALAKAAIAGLEYWSLSVGNAAAVQAETGPWLLGEDPADDLARLEKYQAALVKFYGVISLTPPLKAEELRKQVAAHRKAAGEMPKMPPAQQLSAARANQRGLSSACDAAFETFHDFLDGYFGKTGDKAFAEKSAYAYDRRAGRYVRAAKPPAGSGEGTGDDPGSGTGGGGGSADGKSTESADTPKS